MKDLLFLDNFNKWMSGVVIEVFLYEGGWFVVEFEKQDVGVQVGCAVVYLRSPCK